MERDERASLAPLIRAGVVLAAVVAFGAWLYRRFVRYEVAGESMFPTYQHGDWLIADRGAYSYRLPHPGDAVLAYDPDEPTRTLPKRVVRVDLHGLVWLEGDNTAFSRDSREFGPLPVSTVIGKVRFRYWPLRR